MLGNAVINSVANSNQSSPSVINLEDSDSSDSLALMISNSISASGTPASIVTDYSSGTDLREDSATPKNNDSIMPWFIKSAVFF